jgi:hypothetical protein
MRTIVDHFESNIIRHKRFDSVLKNHRLFAKVDHGDQARAVLINSEPKQNESK